MIVDGENGVFFKPDDVDDLARVVVKLIRDTSSRERLSKAGRAYIENHRRWRDSVSRILPVYEKFVQNNHQ